VATVLGAGDEIRWWSQVIDPAVPWSLLFPGGPGKTNSPEDFGSLMNDLESKIFGRFDDGTVVHPGHGDDTTLGTERPHIGEWWKRGW
jgi:glyoxylase-like metal-dependent hydrolase (beta-lactamase superfamily II)